MSWVCLEQLEVLSRELLHIPWQFLTSPERSTRMGLHGTGLKFPAPIFGVDLFQSGGVLSARRKVLFQFFVPNELILPRDERGELGQLFATQLFYRCLYFRQAHAPGDRGRFQGGTASAAVHRSYGCWNSKFLMTTSTSCPSVGPAWGAESGKWFQFVS